MSARQTQTRRRRERGKGGRARAPKRPPRFLPAQRWARVLIYLAVALAYAAVLWFYVFPWADKTFVNRPAL